MAPGAGVALILGGGVLSLLVLVIGWRRLPAPLAYAFLAVAGATIGTGGFSFRMPCPRARGS
jgi:hypothetical protein